MRFHVPRLTYSYSMSEPKGKPASGTALRRWCARLVLTAVALLALTVESLPSEVRTLVLASEDRFPLADELKEQLRRLPEPITAYAVLSDRPSQSNWCTDQFLRACQAESGGRLNIQFISPALNRVEFDRLRTEYPAV